MSDDDGAVVLYVALTLVAVMIGLVLVLDTADDARRRTRAQSAADVAALATAASNIEQGRAVAEANEAVVVNYSQSSWIDNNGEIHLRHVVTVEVDGVRATAAAVRD